MKTEAMAEILRPGMAGLTEKVEIAFLFGSVATGYDDDEAEKNLVVIGDIDPARIEKAIAEAKRQLSQEVVVKVFTREQYTRDFLAGKIFIRKSANAPKCFFIGNDGDLWHLYYDA